MAKPKYKSVEYLLSFVMEPDNSACLRILDDNRELFTHVQGARCNHQAWPGGYYHHIREVMNFVLLDYEFWEGIRTIPFSLSDLMLICFLHDIEKPWKYEFDAHGSINIRKDLKTKQDQREFRDAKLRDYGIRLTPYQENALKYAEGELNDYSNDHRVMNELAAMVHICDVRSARLWHSYPLEKNDPWKSASRKFEN